LLQAFEHLSKVVSHSSTRTATVRPARRPDKYSSILTSACRSASP
jgi:hypothetical protein